MTQGRTEPRQQRDQSLSLIFADALLISATLVLPRAAFLGIIRKKRPFNLDIFPGAFS